MDESSTMLELAVDVFYVAASFGFVLLYAWIRRFFEMRARREAQETLRAALQSGQPLTADAVHAVMSDYDVDRRDLRWGLILIAVALALLVIAAVLPSEPVDEDLPAALKTLVAASAAFPGFVGVARLILHLTRPKDAV